MTPEPSRLLLAVVLALYLAAALAWWRTALPPAVVSAVSVLLLLHLVCLYRRMIGRTPASAIRTLAWSPARGWRLCGGDGRWHAAQLCLPVFVSHRLVAARFRIGRLRHRSLVIVPGRLPADDFRRLRVRLLQSAHGDRDRA